MVGESPRSRVIVGSSRFHEAVLSADRQNGPSKSTLYRVLSIVPVEVLVAAVSRWAEENLSGGVPIEGGELEGVSLDGKT